MSDDLTRTQIKPVLSDLAALAGDVTQEQRGLPTPCAKYDVAALTGHIVGWLENFAAGFANGGECPHADVSGVEVGTDEAPERIARAAATLDEAVAAGATEHDLVIPGQGGMPGGMALSMMLAEYLLHGWDLARAAGRDWSPDDRAVEVSHAFLDGMVTPEARGPEGMFAAQVPVPADASPLDRLVGFAGRDPQWRP